MIIENMRVFNIHGGGLHPVIVELTTKDGIVGYGEAAVAYGLGANAAAGMLSDLSPRVIGADATYPRHVWQEIYDNSFWTKGGGAIVFAALSAIDQALWDIKARSLGVPVYELFGAKFESSIEVYANGWSTNHDDVVGWANSAERPLNDGYRLLKCYPLATRQNGATLRHVQRRQLEDDAFRRAIERVKTLRKVVGPDIGLMFDLSGGLNNDQLIRFMNVCAELNAIWVEEPFDAFNLQGLRNFAGRWPIPIAAGERIYTRSGFRNLLDTGGVDIVMPDVGNCGGVFELVQIAAMAEAYNVRVSVHNCASSLCTAASVQVAAASAMSMPLETYPYYSEKNNYVQVLKNPPEKSIVNGRLEVPTTPGLGAEIDLDTIEPFRCFDFLRDVA
ncbi:mandelate racemase/muconate lactonizing enzyme family protein [Rhizobium leguminosarum]|uniref:mandelate racemase/muconate lactonizing enzyme family protein n=1 Tax=Rhizobium leguminosarum TaxID=384 RepID=UPI0014429871|nr:mandelate racemase/muconate lactonizing enzyme family protein [Rhizobium leguminosarum]MBY5836289.1 mandelate racemase/muconate lactonizing enzyme family protein [Rhizobium leguminosarum]NKM79019.1 mandelate racemase/muconate lactonizing enzyme family protein [Rhizobium leguminosarum bv. viciae]QSZ08607.1 mandelate racemase/muconate lactonizing enzyme family protein [Rhizobium leguminosarum]